MATGNVKGTLKVQGELQVEFSIGKEENKDISRRFLTELWNEKKDSIIDEVVDKNYIDHTTPCSPSSDELQGLDVLRHVFDTLKDFFLDIHVTIENQIAEDDRVVNLVTWQYTVESDDNPPTAPEVVTVTGISIDRIDNGKIVESWNAFDATYKLLNALGATCPLPPGPVPGPVSCSRTKPCPRGYTCRSGMCRWVG